MVGRRRFLTSLASLTALAAGSQPAAAQSLRGRVTGSGADLVMPGADLQQAIDRAAQAGEPVLLGPGVFAASGLRLPERTRLIGTPGLTRLVSVGSRPVAVADGLTSLQIRGVVFDGGFNPLGGAPGVVVLSRIADLVVDDCTVTRSSGHGLVLDTCGGRVERSAFSFAAQAGLFSQNATGLSVTGNTVEQCGNGGILIWRGAVGEDGTLVQGNRIRRIRADAGGTGQNGNGINIFRAGGVVVSGNHIDDCAFTAIRANSGSNVQMTGNQCIRSGETAIYAEFAFEGAVIANNLVDGACLGISVVNFNEGGRLAVVSGNLVRNLSTRAPYAGDPPGWGNGIAVEADASVNANVVENAPNLGLFLGFGRYLRDVTASANVLRTCTTAIGVSVSEGAGPAMIVDNLIRGARRGAIVGYDHGQPVTGDLARGNAAERHRHLTITGNRVVA
jgi:uncharacterized secreted repeat protein (TIGR03808 family)